LNEAFSNIIAASDADRHNLFLGAAARLGTAVQSIEKDFWVCWTLDALFNGMPPGGPRLLFRGGTSLSKAFELIPRFSEDIDITVFRDDLGQPADAAELDALSGKKRRARLEAIRAACQTYVAGPLMHQLAELAAGVVPGARFRIELDPDDNDGQTLLFWYPTAIAEPDAYIRSAVKVEAGAKSALEPHVAATVRPFVSLDVPGAELFVSNVTTVSPERTFWDKIIILHGLRQWFDRRRVLRHGGQRVSRHYYDVHQLMRAASAPQWLADHRLAVDCARHARVFFGSTDLGLESAAPGTFTLMPTADMRGALAKDYEAMVAMVLGAAPSFDDVLAATDRVEALLNRRAG
jgi:nucleotidyltransferase AbiEii toxin of type IV toxin-antitoxin system